MSNNKIVDNGKLMEENRRLREQVDSLVKTNENLAETNKILTQMISWEAMEILQKQCDMALEFLKKKELARIKELDSICDSLRQENENLKSRVAVLSRFQEMADAERYINEKRERASIESGRLKAEAERRVSECEKRIREINEEIESLGKKYEEGLNTYKDLMRKVSLYTDQLDYADYGIYEPSFRFDTSEDYKTEIKKVTDEEKLMIKSGNAVVGGENITWNGSLSDGKKMVSREKKLMMRAFNGECDSFILGVSWNNYGKMRERINKSYGYINTVYEDQGIRISKRYKDLKIEELDLTHQLKLKKQEEKDRMREERERIREEEKAKREAEAAYNKAKKEEKEYQSALEKARAEILGMEGEKMERMKARIAELEARVAEAVENGKRALSMAQQTKRGFVYVISNIGSFGENVYKVGMTRRLDPTERVDELGDASVPFPFDIHAMIFSENAPELESTIHKYLEGRRVNAVNTRKEFFRCSLSEIESVVYEQCPNAEFIRMPEARDFRETEARRMTREKVKTESNEFPEQLFYQSK